ncbi:MAG: hypothetical protein KDD27_07965 [Saprospiraceae bacterium]|nr:hypothetical protein [Saprospiraceae bacterium]
MTRHGQLFDQFASFQNMLAAFKKARSGASQKRETQAFAFQLEPELFRLQEELLGGSYQPQPYRYFQIHDPKERTISVAAFRDRVVHHALINVLEPIFERCFIHDSYATRKGKGTHKAVERAQCFLGKTGWFWKTDVDKYFDSIRHETLLALLERKIKDRQLLEVAASIIHNGGQPAPTMKGGICGLPIGNLTSQFFANVYLNGFDHFVKETFRQPCYLRYMDDFVVFQKDKAALKALRQPIADYLGEQLGLRLKPSATFLNSAANGLTFLGRRIFPRAVRLARPNGKRMLKRMAERQREYENGEMEEEKFLQSMNSYWSQLEPFVGLRRKLVNW